MSALTDFAAFVVVFTATRELAEQHAPAWYLGVVGGGLAFSQGVGSILGGWLAHRLNGRRVFVGGAAIMLGSIALAGLLDPRRPGFLAAYWLMGIGLGLLYPPLIGWLNQNDDVQQNERGVSRRLILFCVSWNLGMMCGQLTAGSLFAIDPDLPLAIALLVASVTLGLAIVISRKVTAARPSPSAVAGADRARAEIAYAFKRLSWIANLGGMFGGSMVIHLLPDLAVTIGVPADRHGSLLACWRLVIVATYMLMHYSQRWHFNLGAALLSQVLAAGGLLVIAGAYSGNTLLVGLVMLGQLVGYNYFAGLFYSTAGSAHVGRALAAGIHEATLAVGMAAGTVVGGFAATLVGTRTPYQLAAVTMIILSIVQVVAHWRWVKKGRRLEAGG